MRAGASVSGWLRMGGVITEVSPLPSCAEAGIEIAKANKAQVSFLYIRPPYRQFAVLLLSNNCICLSMSATSLPKPDRAIKMKWLSAVAFSEVPGALLSQPETATDAFVTQVPSDARPRQAQAPAAPPPPPTARTYISPAQHEGGDPALIVEQDQAIAPFDDVEKPSLPTIGQGVGVSLVSSAQTLPSVGAGAVVL
jgi:hypothetical protein